VASLIWRTAQKNKEKKIKNRVAIGERVQAKVRGGSPVGRSETTGDRICERGRSFDGIAFRHAGLDRSHNTVRNSNKLFACGK